MKKYSFSDLVNIMKTLRGKDGCPWDKEQTHESILRCLIEEAYEFVDAVHSGHAEHMREELGDVLLQVVFHSQIASESGSFALSDVIQNLCEKLVRRHPHVFGNEVVDSPEGVIKVWDKVKLGEHKNRRQPLGGSIPAGLPPVQKAEKIQKKVKLLGFEWPDYRGPLEKIKEELEELKEEIDLLNTGDKQNARGVKEEFGDLLFSMVNLARHLEIDPSAALEKTNRKFIFRFEKMIELMEKSGKPLNGQSFEVMDEFWERAKKFGSHPENPE